MTADDFRLILFTLGVSRIGQLWETTAAHEIRLQAAEVAGALVRGLPSRAAPSA